MSDDRADVAGDPTDDEPGDERGDERGDGTLHGGGAVVVVPRDVILATGRDALTFLQGQLSQDVAGLAPGGSAWSLLLEPQGKVDAWLRVTRLTDDDEGARLVLDVEPGVGEAVLARLQRFKLRTRCDLTPIDGAAAVLVRRGRDGADDVDGSGSPSPTTEGGASGPTVAARLAAGITVAPSPLVGTEGAEVLVAGDAAAERAVRASGLPEVGVDAFEAARVESGLPRAGAELLAGETIPAEAGAWLIAASVSFTKGCYTGQELVARIDSRGGNVPRPIRALRIEAGPDGVPAPGAEIVVDGAVVGHVTSAAWSPRLGTVVALGPVARAVELPAAGVVRAHGAELPARVDVIGLDQVGADPA